MVTSTALKHSFLLYQHSLLSNYSLKNEEIAVELTSRGTTIFTLCNFRHPNYISELKSKSAETTHRANGDRQVLLEGDSGQDSINNRETLREFAF